MSELTGLGIISLLGILLLCSRSSTPAYLQQSLVAAITAGFLFLLLKFGLYYKYAWLPQVLGACGLLWDAKARTRDLSFAKASLLLLFLACVCVAATIFLEPSVWLWSAATLLYATMGLLQREQPQVARSTSLPAPIFAAPFLLPVFFVFYFLSARQTPLFVDEASYILGGWALLRGELIRSYFEWMYGAPIFYPLIAGSLESIFDLWGPRIFNLLCSLGALLCVAKIAARRFGRTNEILTLWFLGLAPGMWYIARFATYDAPSLLFIAAAWWLLESERKTFLAGLFCLAAILCKYVSLIALLPVFCIVLNRGKRDVFSFFLPLGIVLLLYVALFFPELAVLVQSNAGIEIEERFQIFNTTSRYLWFPILCAVIGAWSQSRRRASLLFVCSALALPGYHVLSANAHALEKHTAYAMLFLSPFAAEGIRQIFSWIRSARIPTFHKYYAQLGALVMLLIWSGTCALFMKLSLRAWPDLAGTARIFAAEIIPPVLAEGGLIHEYIFAKAGRGLIPVETTWAVESKDTESRIRQREFARIFLSGFYTGKVSRRLFEAAKESGYAVEATFVHVLTTGEKFEEVVMRRAN